MERVGSKILKEILDEYISERGLDSSFERLEIEKVWRCIVGPKIDKLTDRVYYKDGVLVCYMNSSLVRNNLYYRQESLRSRLNLTLGCEKVKKIVFK